MDWFVGILVIDYKLISMPTNHLTVASMSNVLLNEIAFFGEMVKSSLYSFSSQLLFRLAGNITPDYSDKIQQQIIAAGFYPLTRSIKTFTMNLQHFPSLLLVLLLLLRTVCALT